MRDETEDTLACKPTRNGVFSARGIKIVYPWGSLIPPRVNFFAWEVWWGRITTQDNVKIKGVQLANKY